MMTRQNQQSGFSLVELMIAMLVGLVLVGAVIQVFVSNKRSYVTADDTSVLNDNARYALSVLSRQLRLSGHQFEPMLGRENSFTNQTVAFSNPSASIQFDPGTYVFGTATNAGNYDTLYMRFQGSSVKPLDVCGQSVSTDTINTVRYSVRTVDYELGSDTGVLGCNVSNSGEQYFSDHVEVFRVLYGIDSNNDDVADKYVSANKVLPANSSRPVKGTEWEQVVSLKIGLLLRSNNRIKSNGDSVSYQVLDKSVSYSDAFARKVVTSTISLRNRLP
ncbi:MAG TPA: prepilin-type N-terminal cleavage/methylation domain-containing protein [Crenotrichaceae bacterium]|nr:prepilin-type N-terminal cleavage/methylation domain-containing protein [Crenotrichaceae bacterium]